ncbi:autotransporter domain-containing protein [Aquabacter sp. CN5-332]|uniref:autotransporter domain-containing protein n=1 Tax=Aquabacter sp. CN5-332 TaxID=3156608 RepID=UPI0032B383B3
MTGAHNTTINGVIGQLSGGPGEVGSLIKTGTGTLTLTGNNSYTGGTFLNGGDVSITANANLGSGALSFDGGTLRTSTNAFSMGRSMTLLAGGGTIETNADLELNGVIDGAGALTKTGPSRLSLFGANTYAGGTIINGGLVYAQADSGFGDPAGGITMNGGGIYPLGGYASSSNSRPITLGTGGGTFFIDGNFTNAGDITGAGGLTKSNTGTLHLTGSNDYTGPTLISAGTLSVGTSASLPQLTAVTVETGAQLQIEDGVPAEIGSLAGAGNVIFGANASLLVGAANAETVFSGQMSGDGSLNVEGAGKLTLTGASDIQGNLEICGCAGSMVFEINGGSLDVGDPLVGSSFVVLDGGQLRVVNGGTLRMVDGNGGSLLVGGTMEISGAGSSVTVEGLTAVGGFETSSLTIGAGGVMTSVAGAIIAGMFDPAAVTVTGPGAIWNVGNGLFVGGAPLGPSGPASLVIAAGGVVNATGGGPVLIGSDVTIGPSEMLVTGASSVLNADGGLTVGYPGSCGCGGDNAGSLTITSGGLVNAAAGLEIGALGTLNIGDGGAAGSINTPTIINDGAIVANFTGAVTLTPVISGLGTLTKSGGGVLTLTGVNTYTGATLVNGGTLLVEGALATASLSVGAGATLGGSGSIAGAVTVANGGTLAPGSSPGTLTVGALALNPASQLNFELGTPGIVGSGVNDLVIVNGALTLDGILNVAAQPGFGPGTYTLFDYGNLAGGDGLLLGLAPGGYTLLVDTATPNQVTLSVTYNGLQFWNGPQTTPNGTVNGGSGTWAAGTSNWTNPDGSASSTWADLTAVFAGPAGGTVTLASDMNVAGLQFTTGGYTLTGQGALVVSAPQTDLRIDPNLTATIAAGITGAGGLMKTGGGTIVLAGNNTYTGGTTINAGVLQVSADANLGAAAGGLTFNGGVLSTIASFATSRTVTLNGTGTIDVAGATTLTAGGSITGGGALVKAGAGALVLSGVNTYTGQTLISAGTLALSGSGSIGSSSGVVANGTFDISATTAGASIQTLSGTGNVALGARTLTLFNASGTFSGIISGSGGLTVAAGTQVLAGANTYTGPTTISGGTLALSGGGSIASSAVVANGLFDISATTAGASIQSLSGTGGVVLGAQTLTLSNASGTFSGVISGSGGLAVTGGVQTLAGANTYAGGTTVSAGTLVLGSSTAAGTGAISLANGATLGFTAGTNVANALVLGGTVTFDLASGAATASGALSGTGAISYTGGGLMTLTGDSSGFAGTTSVAGTLSVNGTLGGTVNVLSGGKLEGTGTVGSTSVAAGGTIAPGNSIGTLTVAGNLTFASGSTYAVEINPAGQSDRLTVTGTATLGGATVSVSRAAGTYAPGTQYTILTAAGGVAGTFGALTQDLPFLNLALSYDATDVYLNIVRNAVPFAALAVTPNAASVANAAEALGQGNPVYNALAGQTNVVSANAAFNALSGEVYPSALSVFQNESLILRRAVLDRARVPVATPANAPLSYAAKATAGPFSAGSDVVAVPGTPNAFWAQGFGAWGQIDGNGNAATISGNTSGVFVGYDRTFSPGMGDWRLGFAAGYSSSSYQVDARNSSFSSDNAHVALYGGGTVGALGVRFGGAYSWADMSASRTVVFPGLFNQLTADTTARTGQVFGEVGYGLSFAGVGLEPFAGLAYVNVDLDDFSEIGGPSALTSSGSSEGVTYSTLGARVSVPLALGTIATSFKGTLAWQHAFGDTAPEALFAFGPGAQPFAISGAPIAADAALIEAGLDMAFTANTTLSVFYAGQLAESDTSNMVKGSFTLRF